MCMIIALQTVTLQKSKSYDNNSIILKLILILLMAVQFLNGRYVCKFNNPDNLYCMYSVHQQTQISIL